MGVVSYEVPLVTQESSPICWVSCMAMVASTFKGYSIGVDAYTNGFSPNNSSIPNPAGGSWDDFYRRLARCGFRAFTIDPKVAELERVLDRAGPLILTHYCKNFPYGPGWRAPADPRATHAVVITAIDTDSHACWMNNPWGDKDRLIQLSAIIYSIKRGNFDGFWCLAAYDA